MKLKDYLENKGETAAAFALRVGTTPSAVSKWINGLRRPQGDAMTRIEIATNGDVAPGDFFERPAKILMAA